MIDKNAPSGKEQEVKSVGLGNVNCYKITGTATGIDIANPMQPVNKPFEIDVTCSS